MNYNNLDLEVAKYAKISIFLIEDDLTELPVRKSWKHLLLKCPKVQAAKDAETKTFSDLNEVRDWFINHNS